MRAQSLAIVSNKIEAKRVLEILSGEKDSIVIAISLEAEFYLKQKLDNWQNPLYDLVLTPRFRSKDYVFSNFSLASDFCNDKYLQHFKIRLGYFLSELERSLDLANAMLQKYKPKLLLIGNVKNYPGSSVVDGTLKTNAMWLLAGEQKIPYRLIGGFKKSFSLKQLVGKKIQAMRYLAKQKIDGRCDLLILATPSHLIQMAPLINQIKAQGINVRLLTYNITVAFKKILDKNFPDYLEKEKLVDVGLNVRAEKVRATLIKSIVWEKFNASKYHKKPIVLNYIRWKIEDIIKNESMEVICNLYLAQKLLPKLRPKALLVTTDPDSKVLPYINFAKKVKIKTICIQHGAFYGKDSPAIYPESDIFIAWSDVSKNWLTRSSYFKHLKILVGNSPFHHYPNISKKIPGNTALTILYLATKQPTVDKSLVSYYLKILLWTLSKVDLDFNLIVRVHPYQDMSNLEPLIKNFNHRASFANDQPLEEVISKSDLVIWENTTAGFDAMLLGKPTVYFNPYSQEDFYNVKAYDASLPILGENDIYEKLPQFIKDKNQWRKYSKNGKVFAIKYLGLNSSYSKLAGVISGIIKK